MKHLPLSRLGVALAIPLMMAGCDAPEPNHANSDPATHVKGDGAGGGWCPLSALATCQAACEQVAQCASSPFFPEVEQDTCSFHCADRLMEGDPEVEKVLACLSEVVHEHACCEVTGCAAAWLAPPASESSTAVAESPQEELDEEPEVETGQVAGPLSVALDGDFCPPDARFTTNGEGLGFCLFEDIELPGPDIAIAYCHFLWDDYIGFHWPGSESPEDYQCPPGARSSSNPEGSLFCVYEELNVPNTASLTPYCQFLEDGVIGYHWCLDPLAPGCGDAPPAPADDALVIPPMETGATSAPGSVDEEATPEEESGSDPTTRGETESHETADNPHTDEHSSSPANVMTEDEDESAETDEEEEETDSAFPEGPTQETVQADIDDESTPQMVEELQEEDAEEFLPEPEAAEAPEEHQEDLRCASMCERLDHCDGLDGSAIEEVQSCVDLCHTWGSGFQTSLFYCNLEEASTCVEVLECWTPGGARL